MLLSYIHTTTAGHDLKSLALNFASIILILLPFGLYGFQDYVKEQVGAVMLVFAVALVIPPMGWMRPHPYSDLPGNRPKKQQ